MNRYFIVNWKTQKDFGQLNVVSPNGGYINKSQIEEHLKSSGNIIITNIIEMTQADYNQYMSINMSAEDEIEALCNYFLKQ